MRPRPWWGDWGPDSAQSCDTKDNISTGKSFSSFLGIVFATAMLPDHKHKDSRLNMNKTEAGTKISRGAAPALVDASDKSHEHIKMRHFQGWMRCPELLWCQLCDHKSCIISCSISVFQQGKMSSHYCLISLLTLSPVLSNILSESLCLIQDYGTYCTDNSKINFISKLLSVSKIIFHTNTSYVQMIRWPDLSPESPDMT